MSAWTNGTYTLKGLALLAKMTQGSSLKITRAAVGTGYLAESQLITQNAVAGERQALTFQPATYPETGKCKLPLFLTNENVPTRYTARQIGLYANDPDEGEILYFIAQSENGTMVPAASEMSGYSATWTFYFQYGEADNVEVTVDPSNAITADMLDEVRKLAEAGASESQKGKALALTDTATLPFAELKIYGRSWQDGVPSTTNPALISSLVEDETLKVYVNNSNLLDWEIWKATPGMGDTAKIEYKDYGVVVTSGDVGDAYTGYNHEPAKIPCHPGVKYVISWEHSGAHGRVFAFPNGSTEGMVSADTSNRKSLEYTPGEGISFFTFRVGVLPANATATYKNIRINVDHDKGFEPGHRQTVTLTIPNGLRGIKVPTGGNYIDTNGQRWACDEIDLARGVYVQRIQDLEFDGGEVMNRPDETDWAEGCYTINSFNNPMHVHGEILCTFLPAYSNSQLADGLFDSGIATHGREVIMVRFGPQYNTKEATKAEWQKALENGGKIIAILEEPIETPLTVDLSSLTACNPETIVQNDSDAEMLIDCVSSVYQPAFEMALRNAGGAGGCTLTHELVGTVHTFTGLSGNGLVSATFKATGDYTAGDTATIDGEAYTIQLTGEDEPDTGLFVTGRAVQVTIDTESKTVNFKSGGGLSNGKLALATATEGTVLLGYSFYAGDKTLKEGTYDPEWAIKKYW